MHLPRSDCPGHYAVPMVVIGPGRLMDIIGSADWPTLAPLPGSEGPFLCHHPVTTGKTTLFGFLLECHYTIPQ